MENKKVTRENVMQWLIEQELRNKPHKEKRVKFPSAKKSNPIPNPTPNHNATAGGIAMDANSARLERQRRRFLNSTNNYFDQEFEYENKGSFVEGGTRFEAFDLEQEKSQGYFDDDGNFVEYADHEQVKDPWLESLDEAGANPKAKRETEEIEIVNVKKRIAELLEPQETVSRALKRLKGDSDNKKGKISEERKGLFDQLSSDALKLIKNDEYDVYERKRESFVTGDSLLSDGNCEDPMNVGGEVIHRFSSECDGGGGGGNLRSDDYVYDENSGYYYSNSLGYFYDPSSTLYCCGATGQWYSFNERTGEYDEVH